MNKATRGLVVLIGMVWAGSSFAAPESSLRPVARPADQAGVVTRAAPLLPQARLRPLERPPSAQDLKLAAASLPGASPDRSPRPFLRPGDLAQKAFLFRRKKRKGSVCGDVEIQGEMVGRVPGKLNGCGVKDAVRVKSVSGVALSQPSVMTCDTAKALKQWVSRGVKPAFEPLGRVAALKVAAHYACRTRNNQRGAKISEHGKGRAIDISGFVLDTGRTITVLHGWNKGAERKALLRSWQAACGPFGTVLGPKADRYHRDHFHMDTARYRSGAYCR